MRKFNLEAAAGGLLASLLVFSGAAGAQSTSAGASATASTPSTQTDIKGDRRDLRHDRRDIRHDRERIRQFSTISLLDLLRRRLLESLERQTTT